MRKCLGVLAGVAALSLLSWAQDAAPPSAPTPAPPAAQTPAAPLPSAPTAQESASTPLPNEKPDLAPKYPRIEWYGGYSFAQAGFFNAGHWAQLNGWNASFGLNAASWLGLVVEGSQFFGDSKIPSGTPAPFFCDLTCPPSPTFNAKTKEYNILFGLQFPYRKYERWTPFGELMFGHEGLRGEATLGQPETVVTSGMALLAGGGADYKVNQRFAVRFKADYLQTRTSFPLLGHAKQDNLRLSVGIVIRSVHRKKRRLEDETQPEP